MRLLQASLIALSLAFGVGGVAHRPLADDRPAAPAAETFDAGAADPEPAEADAAPAGRRAPRPRPGSCHRPDPIRPVAIADETDAENEVITLNTRGYNHRLPGQVETIIPDVTGTKRPAGYPPKPAPTDP